MNIDWNLVYEYWAIGFGVVGVSFFSVVIISYLSSIAEKVELFWRMFLILFIALTGASGFVGMLWIVTHMPHNFSGEGDDPYISVFILAMILTGPAAVAMYKNIEKLIKRNKYYA